MCCAYCLPVLLLCHIRVLAMYMYCMHGHFFYCVMVIFYSYFVRVLDFSLSVDIFGAMPRVL